MKEIPIYCANHPDRVAFIYTFGGESLCLECWEEVKELRKGQNGQRHITNA